MVEKGVRFVQLYDWGWDSHGNGEAESLRKGFLRKCKDSDRPIAALILDLKQRGLLDETLVVWGGEFGRTPMWENRAGVQNTLVGRDHQGSIYNVDGWRWLEKGLCLRKTDEIGYRGIGKGRVSVYDIQATILHLLGFDHEQFTYDFQGRPF